MTFSILCQTIGLNVTDDDVDIRVYNCVRLIINFGRLLVIVVVVNDVYLSGAI